MNHDHDTEALDDAAPAAPEAPEPTPPAFGAPSEPSVMTEADPTSVGDPDVSVPAAPGAAEAEVSAPADEAALAPEAGGDDDAAPEASEEAAREEEPTAPEATADSDDHAEDDGSGAVEAEAGEVAAEDDAGQAPEPTADEATEGADAMEASDPKAAIAESEDPEAAARAALGLQEREEEEELKPEEAAAILAPAEEEEEEEVEIVEETTLEGADLVDVYDDEVSSEPSPYDRPGDWYVVHTYSGYEKKVKSNLETRAKSLHMEGRIHEVTIPMDDVIEFKGGKKTVVQKKVFPGYLLVRMTLDDETWGAVRNTPGVTGFVGGGAKPTPLSRKEVESILRVRPEDEAKKARPRLEFEVGDQVQVKTGPFADFNGLIDEINVDQSTLKVLVNIFGRETPVTLEFADVAKL